MQRSGTRSYSDPEQFQAGLPNAKVALAFTGPGSFKAQQTWVALKHLDLLQIEENLPRIAYLSLSRERVHISFPSNPIFNPVWGGIALRSGEMVFHDRFSSAHDRTMGPNCWGLISIETQILAAYAKHVTAERIAAPPISRILRPSRSAAMRLIQLHRKVCRLAATKPAILANGEVTRALENELLEALGECLMAGDPYGKLSMRAKKLKAMTDFEAVVQTQITRPLTVPKICHMTGVPERTLRAYCTETLGMSPSRYLRLRRLNFVRVALQHADADSTSVEMVARHYQFEELGRFAVAYRKVFGESPSDTLVRPAVSKA